MVTGQVRNHGTEQHRAKGIRWKAVGEGWFEENERRKGRAESLS